MRVTTAAEAALLAAHPARFDSGSAAVWVHERRRLLTSRVDGGTDAALAVSSGCAATGAARHARALADDARHALARLDAGQGPLCETCGDVMAFDRLDGAPVAVRCTRCVPSQQADTRWCR